MIVIVEGIDRVGKTTFCEKLKNLGFTYLKDDWNLQDNISQSEIAIYSVGKLDTTISVLKKLSEQKQNVVVDRLHLTEMVYGEKSRGGNVREDLVSKIDWLLSEMDCSLVYVYPEDIRQSNLEAGVDLTEHEALFRELSNTSLIAWKYFTKYSEIDNTIRRIVANTFRYDLYFASPFFNDEQVEREESLKAILRDKGFKIFSPKESCHLPPDATPKDRRAIFESNCDAIRDSIAVFAITDGKDMGTIWESGFAYGIGKPIVYYAETLGNNQFNLMLAQSGKAVFLDREDVTRTNVLKAIFLGGEEYKGLIE